MIFVIAEIEQGKEVFINADKIVYITQDIGISGTDWTAKIKTEIRYMTYRLDVAYSKKSPHELETVELFNT